MLHVLTLGIFDLFHEGHANLLRSAGLNGPIHVGLHRCRSTWQLKGRFPVQSYDHRERNLKLSGLVEEVSQVKGEDPSRWITMMLADGSDWLFMRGDDMPDFPGRQAVIEAGIPIILHPYTKGISSTDRRCEL